MRRMILLCLLAAVAGGCDPALIGENTSDGTNERSRNDGNTDETTAPDDNSGDVPASDDPEEEALLPKSLYVTGVEYPEGVEWQGDIGYDIAGSRLFLMKDGEKIVELAVGYDECVSIDADMHRCIDGHLYTDFSTDDETVVMIDGVEVYRHAGREMLKSVCVHDGRLYTLSVPRDGSAGWKYRRDGEEIYSQAEGEFVGGLYEDDGDVVFTYKVADTHYMFVNSVLTTISFPSAPTEVFDVRRIHGELNYIAVTDNSLTAMEGDSLLVTFGGFSESYETALRIYYDGGDRFYAGIASGLAGIWQEGDVFTRCDGPPVGFRLRGNSCICVIKNDDGEPETICLNGEMRPWQDGTELMYDTCAATDGFTYTVALINRSEGNAPSLWMNGSVTNYGFNGFFTHVDYW